MTEVSSTTSQPLTSSESSKTIAFSAPGKALLAGGYLVLVPEYNAYVVALSSRMHALIQGKAASTNQDFTSVIARSPQFPEGEWKFKVPITGSDAFQATPL